jgi:acyl dehydratase
MPSKTEIAKIYETLLSIPGMNDKIKIDLRIPRKNVLFLSRIIERGLLQKENDEKIPGVLEIVSKETLLSAQRCDPSAVPSAKVSMHFNALVLDMHPYVADEIFAKREGIFGKRLVAGAFVFSAGLGLVATNCVNAFSYGYDKLRFIKPVFIGDTIYTLKTDLDKQVKYKDMGLCRSSYEVFKNEGEFVLYCEHLQTVKYRDPEAFKDCCVQAISATLDFLRNLR